ncbi:MAG: PAS domain-containing sensor histidine kinase [Rhodobiaceae bacterium]|nr:PAS domain-containing sensor histidine kinase [Rhodobiaceae bacterium]
MYSNGALAQQLPSTDQQSLSSADYWFLLSNALTAEEWAALSLNLALIAFAVLAAILYVRTKSQFADYREKAEKQRAAVAARADRAESLLGVDEQILISWPGGDSEPDIQFNPVAIPDGPQDKAQVLSFDRWLSRESADALEHAVLNLRERGKVFDLMAATASGTPAEITGRTAAGRAVVRIRGAGDQQRDINELRERHLKQSQELQALQTMLDKVELPVWVRDENGALSWVNAAYAHAAGAKTREEAVAGRLEIASQATLENMAKARQTQAVFQGQAEIGPDRRRLELTEVPLRTGAAGLGIDGDAAARMKSALEREAAIRAEILDRIDTAVAIFDGNRRLAFCNKAYRDLWHFDPAWLIRKPDFEEILERLRAEERVPTPPDGMGWREWAASLIDTSGSEVRTTEWDLPNASLSLKLETIPHRDGGSTHLFHNLTESLDLQTRLSAQARVQKQTLESLTEGIAVFGQDGRLKLSNPQFARMWNLDRKALKARPHIDDLITQFRELHSDKSDWIALKQTVCGFLEAREPVSRVMERADDMTVALSTVPLSDGATLAVFTDITAAKAAENALRERNEALEQAAELRGNFVSNVSYHLRDPLQSIIGFAQLLSGSAMTPDPAQQREYAGYILSSSTSLMAIVNDILDLASIQANVLELDVSEVNVRETIDTAVDALKDRIAEHDIDLAIDVAPMAERMQGDHRRIRQMIFSLVANAIAFSDDGGKVTVDAFADGDMVAIRVGDNGPGIPERYRSRVFDSFETHNQHDRNRGPGLGLSLAKGFAEKHGGTIELSSEPGEGTVVTVRLPRTQDKAAETPSDSEDTGADTAVTLTHG